MKNIRNTSLQGLSIVLSKPGGLTEAKYLLPKQAITVPSSWGGKILENLVSRRMIKVVELVDPTPTPTRAPTQAPKKLKR